jgi:murein DD-endopeptidase MepM/ murein hydrolase activator NlpD
VPGVSDAVPDLPGAPGSSALPPVIRFITPVDPWTPTGPGWGEPALRPDGTPLCETNHAPATACDPQGPRPFLHVGVDVLPAADRSVRASAPGLVVWARPAAAAFVGRRASEGGGTIILQHDMDGDSATDDDTILTVYGHVEPLVAEGRVVQEGEVIARTMETGGGHLHFGVRRAALSPDDPIPHHAALPPPGTDGCAPCYSRQAALPPFPDRWDDPATLFRAPRWAHLLKSEQGQEGGSDVLAFGDGYVVAGLTRAADIGDQGQPDGWIARMNAAGEIVSQHAYGGAGYDRFLRLAASTDGGFVALAQSQSFGGTTPAPVLLKFDGPSEHPRWARLYSGAVFAADGLRSTSDGGFVVSGATGPLFGNIGTTGVMRIDASGEPLWVRSFAVPNSSYGVSGTDISTTSDGGFVVVARLFYQQLNVPAGVILRLDADGNRVWSQILTRTVPYQVEATADGFVVVGYQQFAGFWFAKFFTDGTLDWETVHSGQLFGGQRGTRLALAEGGGYFAAGNHFAGFDFAGNIRNDAWVLRIDPDGDVLRARSFDGRDQFDTVVGLRAVSDGGIVLLVGQGEPCAPCQPLPGKRGTLLVRTDADLQVSEACGEETAATRVPSGTFQAFVPLPSAEQVMIAESADLQVLPTGARKYPCEGGSYGPPPDIQSVAPDFRIERTLCDVTQTFVAQLCANHGLLGVTPTSPIILDVMHDMLRFEASVADDDSTPEHSDIERVEVFVEGSSVDDIPLFPLPDDGSTDIEFVQQQSLNFGGKDCFYDPVGGVCGCQLARYPTRSGDAAPADGVFSRDTALVGPASPGDGVDCHLAARGRPIRVTGGKQLELRVRAVDRQGNVTAWPEPFLVTPNLNAMGCSGDGCGCCLLLHPDTYPFDCAGISGMFLPEFGVGLCSLF